jgi:hypothetical protein
MRVVVLYESRTGNTRKAAELIGGAALARGHEVSVRPVERIDYKELALADAVFVGTWCDGAILFGHRPGSARKLRNLPVLDRKTAGAFLTYAIHSGSALRKLGELLEDRGAEVVAGRAYRRDRLEPGAAVDSLVEAVLSGVPAAGSPPAVARP